MRAWFRLIAILLAVTGFQTGPANPAHARALPPDIPCHSGHDDTKHPPATGRDPQLLGCCLACFVAPIPPLSQPAPSPAIRIAPVVYWTGAPVLTGRAILPEPAPPRTAI